MTDPQLGRIERTAAAACLVMAALAWLLGGSWAALAVMGGGLLSAVSYASLASGVSALAAFGGRAAQAPGAVRDAAGPGAGGPGEPAEEPRKTAPVRARTLLKVAGRYALLILLAYVMIARLRLPPVGVLAGLSSVVVAVGIEALRIVVKKP